MNRANRWICCNTATIAEAEDEAADTDTNCLWRKRRFVISQRLFLASAALAFQSLLLGFLIVTTSLPTCAQSASTGALTGTVTDPSSAVVQNAKITLRNYATNMTLTTLTDQTGAYRFALLPTGEYELTLQSEGFTPLVVRGITIQITEVKSIATRLALSGKTETVEVVAVVPLLQTENAALGSVIERGTLRRQGL
jgi:hypothetical protein